MEEYLLEQSMIATYILDEKWDEAHEKSLSLLLKDPENIKSLVMATISSAHGGFFQDTVDCGRRLLLLIENNDSKKEEFSSCGGMPVTDIMEYMAQAYFGLKDYASATDTLEKIKEKLGQLPDSMKQFAVKNENKMNGADAALRLAAQLESTFLDRESDVFLQFKYFEAQICFYEVSLILNGSNTCSDLPIDQAQKAAIYVLRLVSCFDCFQEDQMDEECKSIFKAGKQWLFEIGFRLYTGGDMAHPAMEVNKHYSAASECIMVLEKLSDFGNGLAQYFLGNIYAGEDDIKAFQYYKAAYGNGENDVLINLAFYYNEGIVVEKNVEKAIEYAKKSADGGNGKACGLLGQIYADSVGDIEQALIWLQKGYANGDEMSKNILLRLARENIENFDSKIQFIMDKNKELQENINALGGECLSESGEKYARYFMEIEKYYIAPWERIMFINVCLHAQTGLVTAPKGIVSADFFIGQFEKLIVEDREGVSRIVRSGEIASRMSNLAFAETMENMAAGNFDIDGFNWAKIRDYYYPKALELGWDGYFADGTGPWKPDSPSTSSKNTETNNQSPKTGFVAMDAQETHNNVPSSESKSGGCYIATAVYGSYDCPEVWTLRRFRDLFLAERWYGRMFIKLYYAVSPIFVKWFGNTVWFKMFWKNTLKKMIEKLQKQGYGDSPYKDQEWK